MRRVLRRLSAGLLALVLLITYSVPLVGLAYDEQAAKAAASEDCRTWRQQDTRWKDYMMGTSSGSSVGDVGCLMIAMSMMIKICEVKGDSFQPMDFITYTKQIGGFSSGGGFNNYGNVGKYTDNKVVYVGRRADLPSSIKSTVLTGKKGITDEIKALTDAGYYVIPHVAYLRWESWRSAGHFVFCLGYDEKGLLIADGWPDGEMNYFTPDKVSSRSTSFHLSDYYREPEDYIVFQCTEKPFNENNTYFSGKTGSNSASNGITMTDIMHRYGEDYWLELEGKGALEEMPLIFRSGDDMSMSERDEISDWKQTLEYKKEDKTHGVLRAIVMLVGIIIIVYSTLLFLAFQFDRINNFIDVPLLYFLSGGKMMTINEDEQSTYNQADNKGAKMMKQKDICIMAVVGIIVGVLLLSGGLFEIISIIVSLIGKLMNKI